MNDRVKIISPTQGRSWALVANDYPDEMLRYVGYADAPKLNAAVWAALLADGRADEVRQAAKRFDRVAHPLSADFVATESALHYVHPFATQYYRFLWSDIGEMYGGFFNRKHARQAGLARRELGSPSR